MASLSEIASGSEVEEKEAAARSFFWNNCISFLNKLLSSRLISFNEDRDNACFCSMTRYDEGETVNLALWEDYELRGFIPLVPVRMILDFSRKQSFGSDGSDKEKKAHFQRIIAAGKSLVSVVRVGQECMYFDPRLKKFAIGVEPQISDSFVLTSSLEMPASNGMVQEHSQEKKMNVGVCPPKAQLYVEGEEEEVIVFQSFVTDKHADVMDPKFSYDVLVPGGNASQGDMGNCVGSVTALLDGRISGNALGTSSGPPNAFNAHLIPPTSFVTILPQQLQSIQPSTSKWQLEQQACLASGLSNLNLTENGLVMKSGLQEYFEVLQPAALSVPFPRVVNISAGNELFAQVSDSRIPSKFAAMSTGVSFDDGLSLNTSWPCRRV